MRHPRLALVATVLAVSGCGVSGHSSHQVADHPAAAGPTAHGGHDTMAGHAMDEGNGLLTTEDGYTLAPLTTALTVGKQTVRFQINDASGKAVTTFVEDQTKLLHFYLVRADITGYVHDHPTLAADGTWSIEVDVKAPGPYRMYTDFIAKDGAGTEHPLVLSTKLTAPGTYAPVALPPASTTQIVDGLTVTMKGALADGKLTFTVAADGKPVTDLEPYLDSYAHLTAVHAGDLAYEHVHPELAAKPGEKGGPDLPFSISLPETGTWRLFLQVQRGGALQLIPFTVTVA